MWLVSIDNHSVDNNPSSPIANKLYISTNKNGHFVLLSGLKT